MAVGLQHFLVLSAALNFVAFSRFVKHAAGTPMLSGQVFAIFVIVLAAAEAAIALAIIITIFHARASINADELQELKQ